MVNVIFKSINYIFFEWIWNFDWQYSFSTQKVLNIKMAPNNLEELADALAKCEMKSSNLKQSQPNLKNLSDFGKPAEEHNVILQSLGK